MLVPFRNRASRAESSKPIPLPRPTEDAIEKFRTLVERQPVVAFVIERLVDRFLADDDCRTGSEAQR